MRRALQRAAFSTMDTIVLPRPDDWHLHLRDGAGLVSLMKEWPGIAARAIVMPNLKPPVTTTADALAYRCGARGRGGGEDVARRAGGDRERADMRRCCSGGDAAHPLP
jgi:hypothetical protein